jgi:hypothetical protein
MIDSSSAAALLVLFSFSLVRALRITSLQGLSLAFNTIFASGKRHGTYADMTSIITQKPSRKVRDATPPLNMCTHVLF